MDIKMKATLINGTETQKALEKIQELVREINGKLCELHNALGDTPALWLRFEGKEDAPPED